MYTHAWHVFKQEDNVNYLQYIRYRNDKAMYPKVFVHGADSLISVIDVDIGGKSP
jgi:hypothetical protein